MDEITKAKYTEDGIRIKLENELAHFIGTEHYYPSTFGNLKLTDGVQYLGARAGAFWFIDIIESYYLTDKKIRNSPFLIWGIKVNKDRTALVYCKEDSDQENLVTQEIEYTDFPLDEFELYCIDGVVLLKSEY